MKIEHIAIWSEDIEKLKKFYISYFEATSNDGYINNKTGFKSYFLTFNEGARLEIMQIEKIKKIKDLTNQYLGYCHMAICVDTTFEVKKITEKLKKDGYQVLSEPRITGDGYFESVILDPEGNHVEITCEKR